MLDSASDDCVRIITGDRDAPPTAVSLPVTVVLDNLRSAFNVGNILRVADAVRVSGVVTCGYTASPPHPKLAKTARGCDTVVPCRPAPNTAAALGELRRQGCRIYGVETAATATVFWETSFVYPMALVFGNEALGLSEDTLSACDAFVALPAYGMKNSINVGNCAAVVLYEVLRQWLHRDRGAQSKMDGKQTNMPQGA